MSLPSTNQEEVFQAEHLDLNLWKQMFKLIWVHKKKLLTAFVFSILGAVGDISFPLLNRYAIDTFIGKKDLTNLVGFSILYVFMVIFFAFMIYLFIHICGQIEMDLAYDLRRRMMNKLQTLDFSYYDVTSSGWILSRATSDIARISEIFSWALVDTLWGVVMLVSIFIILTIINFQMLLWILIIVPILIAVTRFFQKRILKNWRDVRFQNSQITAGFSEGILGAKTTKTMSLEELHYSQFTNLTNLMGKKSKRASYLSAFYGPFISLIASISLGLILADGGHQVLQGAMSIGTMMLFVNYAQQFFQPMRQIAGLISELQMAQASSERVLSLLNREEKVVDSSEVVEKYGTILEPKPENYEPLYGDIEFRNVGFYYNPNEIILDNFNLTVQKGQSVALVGETGSGKSTLANLICRFYEPTSGQILIDGKDYKERSLGWLHSNLGYVLQSPHLFSGTIAENIRFGKLDASMDEVIAVAKLVHAHEFIMNQDNGYESEVGEGGSKLSTGQKQLISFARALINNPALIVLDEATASIDTQTEQYIQDAIDILLQDRTSIVVAHRLSTIVKSDIICVIDKGVIIEQGTHQELLDLKGQYYNLYTNQFNQEKENHLLKKSMV